MPSVFTKIIEQLLENWPALTGLLLFILIFKILGSAGIKGRIGEWAVHRGLAKLDPAKYQAFHDLYFARPDGKGTTQIDHIVLSQFGIFVIETKNYCGWIFSSPKQAQWTSQIYKRKDRFQNPLFQNDLHVRALSEFLGIPKDLFIPVVLFVGDSKFKTEMPDNVLKKGLLTYIQKFNNPFLTPQELIIAKESLVNLEQNTNRKAAAKAHLISLNERKMARQNK